MIVPEDCFDEIKEQNLKLVIENNDDIFYTARRKAIGRVKASLHKRYNVDLIFSKTGENRDDFIIELLVAIVVYRLYKRTPNGTGASDAKESYHNALIDLERIEDGKKSLDLPRIQRATTGGGVANTTPSANFGGEEYKSCNDLL